MAYEDRKQQIALLKAVGVQVQTRRGGTNYLEAVDEGSRVLPQAASFVQGLMERYVSLAALVQHRFRTPQSASDEFVRHLSQAREDVRDWAKRTRGDVEVIYVARTLEGRLTETLDRVVADKPRRY